MHATLKERPVDRFTFERQTLGSLPLPYAGRRFGLERDPRIRVPIPVKSLQHPLAMYEQLVGEIPL